MGDSVSYLDNLLLLVDRSCQCFRGIEGKVVNAKLWFLLSSFRHLELRSSNGERPLLIIPFGVVACAFIEQPFLKLRIS